MHTILNIIFGNLLTITSVIKMSVIFCVVKFIFVFEFQKSVLIVYLVIDQESSLYNTFIK